MTMTPEERAREIAERIVSENEYDWTTYVDAITSALLAEREAAKPQWRTIAEAKKDGTVIWAKFRDDIYPRMLPHRDDLARWNGVHAPLRHPGIVDGGFDVGWNVALPVGHGGFPDEWIEGWLPLPLPPPPEHTPTDAGGGEG